MNYRREIDGLRALAVLPVIFFHAGFQTFSGGFVGVDVFFVISGYLITSIIIAEKEAGTFSIIRFYERRARRILPALFLVMFACLPFAWFWLLPGDMKEFSQSLTAVSVFASNILFWRQSGYFDTSAELKPLLHTWSLAVEEQYYLLFPIFLSLTWRFGKRWIVVTLVFLSIISLMAAQWFSVTKQAATFFLLPTRGWEILIGSFVAFYLFRKEDRKTKIDISEALSISGLLLIIYGVCAFDQHTPYPSLYALIPTIGTALVILFATQQTLVGKLLGSKLLVSVGLISYSAYLWHHPLFAFARHRSIAEPSRVLIFSLAVVSLLLAYLSWKLVEMPFRNRQRIKRNQVFLGGALCGFVFVLIGLIGNFTPGFAFRYSQEDRDLAEVNLTDAGKYTEKRFSDLDLRDFDTSNKKKVILIGDSYAEDLVNAVYESGLSDSIQLSTRYISSRCGNLFLESDFKSYIDKADLAKCNNNGWFDDKKLRELMLEADEIWLASSWSYWQAELLPQSIQNLRNAFGKKVLLFGTKSFGSFKINNLLAKPAAERYEIKNSIDEGIIKTNALMKATLSKDVFVDVSYLLCEDVYVCPLFTKDGKLISYDGGHLTMYGAKYYGERLSQHPLLQFLAKKQELSSKVVYERMK